MEKEVRISAEDVVLEGRYEHLGTGKGGLVAHPHPLYGGNMHNNVVLAVRDAFLDMGISTLRFNFRGVGNSEGYFGQGIEERKDIYGAIEFLRSQGNESIYLAGYSFGARVLLDCDLAKVLPRALLLISLPVGVMPVGEVTLPDLHTLVVTGDRDEIAPLKLLKGLFEGRPGAKIIEIKGADHFYWGKEKELFDAIIRTLREDELHLV